MAWIILGVRDAVRIKHANHDQKGWLLIEGLRPNSALPMFSQDKVLWEGACSQLGFRPHPTQPLLIKSVTAKSLVTHNAQFFQKVFPKASRVTNIDPASMRVEIRSAKKTTDTPQQVSFYDTALAIAKQECRTLGFNNDGERVFEISGAFNAPPPTVAAGNYQLNTAAVAERFYLNATGERVRADATTPHKVLDFNEQNLDLIAAAYVQGLLYEGVNLSDIDRFVDITSTRLNPEKKQQFYLDIIPAIERAMQLNVVSAHQLAGESAWYSAKTMYENLPAHFGSPRGEGALPLPIAVGIQECLRAYTGSQGASIYIPKIYDGALVSMVGDSNLVLTNPAEIGSADLAYRASLDTVSSVSGTEPTVIESDTNTPPHRISVLSYDKSVSLTSLEEDLSARQAIGLTALVLPELEDTSVLSALSGNYVVLGHIRMAPIMRSKLGVKEPLHLLFLGRKISAGERRVRQNHGIDNDAGSATLVHTYEALRSALNDTVVKIHEAAGHKLSAEDEAALRTSEEDENSFQAPYQSYSMNGEPESMLPRNLAAPTYQALESIQEAVSNIDAYVQTSLGLDDLNFKALAPEQVDACALMIQSLDQGRGFVLGDQTGLGKGRTLAAMAAYAWQRGVPVIFLSKQDELFSSFYSDLKSLGVHGKIKPLILNAGAKVIDQFVDGMPVVAQGIDAKLFKEKFRFGLSAFGSPNIIMTTYSQFNRGSDSAKSDFIQSIANECFVLSDESHLAAGDSSNIGQVCTYLADHSKGIIYSSGTWLKGASQIAFYNRMLPDSVSARSVAQAIDVGGVTMQELFAAMLVADGRMIRRERNSSDVIIHSVEDSDNLKSNEAIADQLSVILQALQRVCGVTQTVGRRLTAQSLEKLDESSRVLEELLERNKRHIEQLAKKASLDSDAIPERVALVPQDELSDDAVLGQAETFDSVATAEDAQRIAQLETVASGELESVVLSMDAALSSNVYGGTGRSEASLNDSLETPTVLWLADLGIDPNELDAADKGRASHSVYDRMKAELTKVKQARKLVNANSTALGSLIFLTQRTLNVALQARFAGRRAVAAIKAGKKPIIFLEQTFEKHFEEAISAPGAISNDDGSFTIKPITVQDNLRKLYASVTSIRFTNELGDATLFDAAQQGFHVRQEEQAVITSALSEIEKLIEQFPADLYCSPLDTIQHAIRSEGFTVGEATGRGFKVTEMRDDSWTIVPRKASERNVTKLEHDFNFGHLDALVGNRAMSTGFSLHASEKFSDRRQRNMIFAQVFPDVNDYVQALGRGDRRGQVVSPVVEMLQSGLPSEARVMMADQAKLRKLLASSTSNRNSTFENTDLPDLFNHLGDLSVRDYLQANPGVGTRLGVPSSSYMPSYLIGLREEDVVYRDLAKLVVSRLDLLPVAEARLVYKEITHNFHQISNEMTEMGLNPLKTNEINFSHIKKAGIIGTETLLPARKTEGGKVLSVFDEGVDLATVRAEQQINARSWDQIRESIAASSAALMHDAQERYAQMRITNPSAVMDLSTRSDRPEWVDPRLLRAQQLTPVPDSTGSAQQTRPLKLINPAGLLARVEKMFVATQIMLRSSDAERKSLGEHSQSERTLAQRLERLHTLASDNKQFGTSHKTAISPDLVIEKRRAWLIKNMPHFMPGMVVNFQRAMNVFSGYHVPQRGVITDLKIPPLGRETNLARWRISIQSAGYSAPVHVSALDLYKGTFQGTDIWLPNHEYYQEGLHKFKKADAFSGYATSELSQQRFVLTGNLFRAAVIAANSKLGASAMLSLPGETPQRVIGVKTSASKTDIYSSVPAELSAHQLADFYCMGWDVVSHLTEKNAVMWNRFSRGNIQARGVHSTNTLKEVAGALPYHSFYWVAKRRAVKISELLADENAPLLEHGQDGVLERDEEDPQLLGQANTQAIGGYAANQLDIFSLNEVQFSTEADKSRENPFRGLAFRFAHCSLPVHVAQAERLEVLLRGDFGETLLVRKGKTGSRFTTFEIKLDDLEKSFEKNSVAANEAKAHLHALVRVFISHCHEAACIGAFTAPQYYAFSRPMRLVALATVSKQRDAEQVENHALQQSRRAMAAAALNVVHMAENDPTLAAALQSGSLETDALIEAQLLRYLPQSKTASTADDEPELAAVGMNT